MPSQYLKSEATLRRGKPFDVFARLCASIGLGCVAFLVLLGANALAECPAAPSVALAPGEIDGIRTKWEFRAKENFRRSIAPDLAGLDPATWIQRLQAAGVNLIELNLDPSSKLARSSEVSDPEFKAYIGSLYTRSSEWTQEQSRARSTFRNKLVPSNRYTVAQRNAVLLSFLERIETARSDGLITGAPPFLLHQRLWFRPGKKERQQSRREARIAEFASDMGDFVQLAKQRCLDHWIAGIRLGENGNSEMSEYLPVVVELARAINERTGGWLKSHLFVANGGGMGAQYAGFEAAAKHEAFFSKISHETGTFSFAYKWMIHGGRKGGGIAKQMESADCDQGRSCDPAATSDWETYLGQRLGFEELAHAIKAERSAYPKHANVVFAGDSSDSLALLVDRKSDGALSDSPELKAVRKLWPREWRGKIFMNGVVGPNASPRLNQGATPDVGFALYYADDKGNVRELTQSMNLWKSWPSEPALD
jgi:hypothetical protein